MAISSLQRRFSIVVALDFTDFAEIVLEHALDQAARHERTDLHVVTVIGKKEDREMALSRLATVVRPTLADFNAGERKVRVHVRQGAVHEEVATLAADLRADLIVVGRYGLHHPNDKKASFANQIIEAAGCPTLVIGMVDDSPDAKQCPACALVRAQTEGAQIFCAMHREERDSLYQSIVPEQPFTGDIQTW